MARAKYERVDGAARTAPWGLRGISRRNMVWLGVLLAVFTLGVFAMCLEYRQGNAYGTIQLTTSPELIEDGGDLVVSWKGTARVNQRDYLTISCGPQRDQNDYLQRKNVTEVDATSNSVRFTELYMMRCEYKVEYFQFHVSSKSFHSIASVTVGMRESFNAPKHGHLALTTEENAMAIMFNSASSRTPEVQYGLNEMQLDFHATGTSTTYSASDMCHAPASTVAQRLFRDPGYMHTVVMSDLVPGRAYFYRYGNDMDGWSAMETFRSRPSNDSKTAKFIAYGDMGVDPAPAGQSNAVRVYADVAGDGFDSFLLHFGDISYAQGEGSVWDKFFRIIEPFATRVPYMVSVGNHEYDYTSGGEKDPSEGGKNGKNGFHPSWGNYGNDSMGECSVPMYHRFHVPSTGNSLYWYSFNYAGIHVIQMSTEHDYTRGSKQYQWLISDLAKVDRTETPWIVLTAHRMMYSTQVGLDKERVLAAHFREELEEVLFMNRVNLVLAGHQHSYERSCPVYQSKCVVDSHSAPVHIIVGSAGFDMDSKGFSTKYGYWSEAHGDEYGHLRVSTTAEQMHIEFVANRNGVVYDETILTPY